MISTGIPRDGEWHQVVTSCGLDGVRLYVDGVLVSDDGSGE